jgi:hypothetical protein
VSVLCTRGLLAILLLATLTWVLASASARAEGFADDGGAQWRVEQPQPPAPPAGLIGSSTPIGLGSIGDIQFWAPNRGALITAGNGSTVPAGVWLYNGERWRELSNVCGATDGRITWAGENEFWTVSDGRPGQAAGGHDEQPKLEDNTLCHFAPGPSGKLEVVASYASPAFQSNSYQEMHGAACIDPTDCWFAGGALPAPQIGAFQLHWNGSTMEAEPYLQESYAVEDMREFEGRLFEGLRLLATDPVVKLLRLPPPLHVINGEGVSPTLQTITNVPLLEPEEFPFALEYLNLGSDQEALWAAAGPALTEPAGSKPAGVTIVRYAREAGEETSSFTQILGPETIPVVLNPFNGEEVAGIAAEPETSGAWVALESYTELKNGGKTPEYARATLARIAADGTISDRVELPEDQSHGPLGATTSITCPAIHDCWMTTARGWLLHLSAGAALQRDTDPVFSSEEPIASRPEDLGVPQHAPDAPPPDDSGLEEAVQQPTGIVVETHKPETFATVPLPLLSHEKTRLVDGTTLELSFHLAVRSRVRLIAERHHHVVASTKTQTLKAGNRKLRLKLDARRWPTKLNLQTHALGPLPTGSTREPGINSVSTSLAFPNTVGLVEPGRLP